MRKPNIVLINCDDLGYGDLSCYGSAVNHTPNIDRLATEGTRFTDFYMASPVCSPSRGAMLTGCYPPRIGFGDFEGQCVLFPGQGVGLSAEETTIAGLLQSAGYRTKIVGKWHCGDQKEFLPLNHGFDSYYGLPFSNDMGRQVGHRAQFPPLPLIEDGEVIEQQPDLRALTERYVCECLKFMTGKREEPFFLYLAHMHVHLPLYASEAFHRVPNGDYGACLAAVDWATACILHKLDELGLTDDTLVIFTSDNGSRGDHGGSNLPLRGSKGTTWEGGMRVPCLMRWPGHIPAGRVCRELISSIDFLPTFSALCGAGMPKRNIDGVNMLNLILGVEGAIGRESFAYYWMNDLEAVRRGRWKLHVRKGGNPVQKLYDLEEDIGETENLYEKCPHVVSALERVLDSYRKELGDRAEGIAGAGVREIGRVDNPAPLTRYDEGHPYIVAMYDKPDVG